jgi:hypothetical protein
VTRPELCAAVPATKASAAMTIPAASTDRPCRRNCS